MIDFDNFECVKLEDVAEFGRAKAGYIYPAGTSTIQISATKGQIDFLEYPREVPTKEVVIIPKNGIEPKYFNLILQRNVEKFIAKYATGINIQEKEIGNFPIELFNRETQKAFVRMMDHITDEIATAENELIIYKEMKKAFLGDLML